MPLSYTTAQGDGNQTVFNFTWDFLLRSHVKVYIGRDIIADTGTLQTDGVHYSWSGAKQITFSTAPTNSQVVHIERQTPNTSQIAPWSDGSNLTAEALNNADLQNLYVVQEQQDRNDLGATEARNATTNSASATSTANAAQTTANAALSRGGGTMTGDIVMGGNRVTGLPNPASSSEPVIKSYFEAQSWDNTTETIASDETWAGNNTKIATTGAIDGRIDSKIDTAIEGDVLAGTDLTKTQTGGQVTLNHSVTGASSVNNSNGVVLQDLTINPRGHITGHASIDLDTRYYKETELDAGQLDNRYFTETELLTNGVLDTRYFTQTAADARFYNLSSGEEIQSGETWAAADNKIATTAAIDARIIDLVDDVGGFVPIANETSFPAANPDVNNGAGTLVSIQVLASSHTPSGGSVTISNGAGSGNTVTISGVGTTTLPAGFGVIVETTSTLHTYTFHRLTPKATEVTTVAGNNTNITTVATNIANINTVASDLNETTSEIDTVANAIANVNTVGNAIANVNTTATNIANINTVASDLNETTSEIDTVATNIANVNTVGGAIANVNTVANDLNETTSEINTVAVNIANVNTVGNAITNVNSVGGSIANVNTVATNLTDVSNYADRYQIASSDPSTRADGSSLQEGDQYFNTTSNVLKVYDGSNWNTGVTDTTGFAVSTGQTFTGNVGVPAGTNSAPGFFIAGDTDTGVYSPGANLLAITASGTNVFQVGSSGATITGNIAVSGTVDGRDIASDGTKLDTIESNSTGDQTAAEIRTLVESASDSNVFTDADHTKLNNIESNATADQSNAEIRAAVDAASDSNVFTDADHTKLDGIAASANNYSISSDLLDEDNFASNSATKPPSQQSVKAYIQTVSAADAATYATINNTTLTGTANGANLILSGDLTVNGTTTTINSTTISVDDKNIELGSVSSPSDATADGGGITLKGATDKTITWTNATDSWDFNQNIKTTGMLHATTTSTGVVARFEREGTANGKYDFQLFNDAGTDCSLALIDSKASATRLTISSAGNATFGGTVTATTFSGSGASLTNLPAANLTGTLPAISGANLTNLPPGGNTFTAVADGAIANNKALQIGTDGKVKEIAEAVTTLSSPDDASITEAAQSQNGYRRNDTVFVYHAARQMFMMFWKDNSDSSTDDRHIKGRVGSLNSSGTITWANEVNVSDDSNWHAFRAVYDPDQEQIVVVGYDSHWSNKKINYIVVNINADRSTSISSPQAVTIAATTSNSQRFWIVGFAYDTNLNKFCLIYSQDQDEGSLSHGYGEGYPFVQVGSHSSGTTYSWGSRSHINTSIRKVDSDRSDMCFDATSNCMVWFFGDYQSGRSGGNSQAHYIVGEISNSSNAITWRNKTRLTTVDNTVYKPKCIYDPTSGKTILVYKGNNAGGISPSSKNFGCQTLTVNSNSLSLGSYAHIEFNLGSGSYMNENSLTYDSGIGKIVCIYPLRQSSSSNDANVKVAVFTVSGTSISVAVTTIATGSGTYKVDEDHVRIGCYDSVNRLHVTAIWDDRNNNSALRRQQVFTVKTQSITSNYTESHRFVGFADQAYSNGQTVTVKTYGNNVDTLSGLNAGTEYYVQGDGTLGTSSISTFASGAGFAGLALSSSKLLIGQPG